MKELTEFKFSGLEDLTFQLAGQVQPYKMDLEKLRANPATMNRVFIVLGDADQDLYVEEQFIIVHLIEEGIIFTNSHWWKAKEVIDGQRHARADTPKEEAWPEEATRTVCLAVNCNDTFVYASADADEVFYDELESLYAHWLVDNTYGSTVWCMKKRGWKPLPYIFDHIQKTGIWDLTVLDLKG